MTKAEKLLKRFLSRPKDFTYNELLRLLNGFSYKEQHGSGSRVIFSNDRINHNIKLHKPHPGNVLKRYQIDLIIFELKTKNLIWIFIGFYLIIGVISQIMFEPSFILYYASVFGVIGGYLGVRKYVRPQVQQYY